ncbi:MAG: membrane lipoprotein lipid attachment site-containing protein [Clostridium sp.]|nr:membrane lipoprotein lipid attachment site-containing protein [Clostridium sp.]MCM1208959.1 membrane lipoprotein lipid attachment site-containing protein [Ruminococcus sp.]
MKKIILVLVMAICLTGCTDKKLEQYREEATRRLEVNLDEPFEYKKAEVINKDEERYRYEYVTTDRELDFFVESYLQDGQRVYYTNYHECIADGYSTQIINCIMESDIRFDVNNLYVIVDSAEDALAVSEVFEKCELLYSVENQFHESDYTAEHSPMAVSLTNGEGTVFMEYGFSDYYYSGLKPSAAIYDEIITMYSYEFGEELQ